jgi:hypothetical protein
VTRHEIRTRPTDDAGGRGKLPTEWGSFIAPPEGLVNSRPGQHVGRPPIGLADELGQHDAFALIRSEQLKSHGCRSLPMRGVHQGRFFKQSRHQAPRSLVLCGVR